MTKLKMLAAKIPADLEKRIIDFSVARGITKTKIVVDALRKYFSEMDAVLDGAFRAAGVDRDDAVFARYTNRILLIENMVEKGSISRTVADEELKVLDDRYHEDVERSKKTGFPVGMITPEEIAKIKHEDGK